MVVPHRGSLLRKPSFHNFYVEKDRSRLLSWAQGMLLRQIDARWWCEISFLWKIISTDGTMITYHDLNQAKMFQDSQDGGRV